jgi:amino acid adenylation domain-containing protein
MNLLHDLLDERAAATPDAPAMVRDGRTWSYAEVAALSRSAAAWLHAAGIERGDRVVIVGGNEAEIVPLLYATSRIAAVFVLVGDQVGEFHLRHIISDSGARMVLANAAAAPAAETIAGPAVYPLTEPFRHRAGEAGNGGLSVDPACFIYTSGSTSLPKAVISNHRQMLFAITAIQSRLGYRADDTVFCCLPLSFDYGLYQAFLSAHAGAKLVLGNESDAGPTLLRRLIDEEVTVLPLVPSLAVTLCRLIGRTGVSPRLRMVTNTGADLSASQCARLRKAVPGLQVYAMFGLTECKRVSIAEADLDLVRPGSVGRPLPDTEVSIVDDDGQPVKPGVEGELVVRGPHVMSGYWNAPELTAKRFRRDEYGASVLYTGDRARLDEDGYLYFLGRDDDVYKQNGVRVSTAEIEAAALDIPAVEIAAALPARGGRAARIAACGALTLTEFTEQLRHRLGPQKTPPEIRLVDRLPLGVNGKVDRLALAATWDQSAGAPL